MSEYLYSEAALIVHSFLLGVVLMISYDLLRLLRLFIPHNPFWIGVEDFLYCIGCAVMTFCFLFWENNGVFRGYVIIGAFSGMILYDRVVSQTFFFALKKVKRWFTTKNRRFTIKVRGLIKRIHIR